jgi:hypothetical protein
VDAVQPPFGGYDIVIGGPKDWAVLARQGLDVIIDPFVFRVGQFFLEGREAGPDRWRAIESDLGALVNFFDLVVLHDRLPAFNYPDTFAGALEFRGRLGDVLNVGGDKTLVQVDVEHHPYSEAKVAALGQLSQRMDEGPLVTRATADAILRALDLVQYEWEPRLEILEPRLPDVRDQRVARFLLGQLVFSGYAQQTGAQHVLAGRRSTHFAAASMRAELKGHGTQSAVKAESEIYKELARRVQLAGAGWRDEEVPWTPSFLPFLLGRIDPITEGPDVLLRWAKDLRDSKAVRRYRQLREALMSGDAAEADQARKYLAKAADKLADELRSNREELEVSRHVIVELMPKALGAAVGAAGGFVVAGPPGAIGGAVVGVVGEDVLTRVNERLWGWVIDELPFRSARKLLARSVRAESQLKGQLGPKLRAAWETGRA